MCRKTPKSSWAEIEPYVANHLGSYISFAKDSLAAGRDPGTKYAEINSKEIRHTGKHQVLTPNQCVALAKELGARHIPVILQPLVGGLPPEIGWKSLELFARSVLPRLKG